MAMQKAMGPDHTHDPAALQAQRRHRSGVVMHVESSSPGVRQGLPVAFPLNFVPAGATNAMGIRLSKAVAKPILHAGGARLFGTVHRRK